LLFGGFIFGKPRARDAGRMPAWTRMASSVVLVVAAWSWYAVGRGTSASTFALLIAIGMTLGFLGDLFMGQLLPVRGYVLWGMGSFGLGHVAYIVAGVVYGNQHGLVATGPRFGAWAVWLSVGLAGWFFVVFRGQKPTVLHWVALPYALLLASTAGVATGLALQDAAFWPMAAGAALFLLSDLILAAQLFNNRTFHLINDVIWLTYGPGQMLIVYSVAGALGFARS
jgi:hypothetical protein